MNPKPIHERINSLKILQYSHAYTAMNKKLICLTFKSRLLYKKPISLHLFSIKKFRYADL